MLKERFPQIIIKVKTVILEDHFEVIYQKNKINLIKDAV